MTFDWLRDLTWALPFGGLRRASREAYAAFDIESLPSWAMPAHRVDYRDEWMTSGAAGSLTDVEVTEAYVQAMHDLMFKGKIMYDKQLTIGEAKLTFRNAAEIYDALQLEKGILTQTRNRILTKLGLPLGEPCDPSRVMRTGDLVRVKGTTRLSGIAMGEVDGRILYAYRKRPDGAWMSAMWAMDRLEHFDGTAIKGFEMAVRTDKEMEWAHAMYDSFLHEQYYR